MNLKETKGSSLIQQSIESNLSDMQLKEDSVNNSVQTDVVHEVGPKNVCVGKSKVCENGTTCPSTTLKQDNITNGTASFQCDKVGDNSLTGAASESCLEMDSNCMSSKLHNDTELHLAECVQSLSLDLKPEKKKFESCNGIKDVDKADTSTNFSAANECSNGHSFTKENKYLVDVVENMSDGNCALNQNVIPTLTNLSPVAINAELTCETNFLPKMLTPDSGLSAELEESDPASSPMSNPSSDGMNREVLESAFADLGSSNSDKTCTVTVFDNATCVDFDDELFDDDDNLCKVYEFEIKQELCGLLIGRQGRHVNYIKEKSNAEILIQRHPLYHHMKMCAISGTNSEVSMALQLIRNRFPLEKYPDLTLVNTAGLQPVFQLPVTVKLTLPEGVTFDVIVSNVVDAGHFFVHQPTHPTYHTLSYISNFMSQLYSNVEAPKLCRYAVGYIVAAPICGGWYRCEIMHINEDMETAVVKILDFGGFMTVILEDMRQLSWQYSQLPFQAAECFLADVTYPEGDEGWSNEAKSIFEELAQGQIIQGYIVGYEEHNIPYVHLYRVQGASSLFINQELVRRGLARLTN